MPASRRRVLAAAAAALLAGCNSSDGPERTTTVTPVDIPQSPDEMLQAVESVSVPSIPPAPIVSTPHRRAVVGHVEGRIEAAAGTLQAAETVAVEDVEGLGNPEAPLADCRSQLRAYAADPSWRQFRRLTRSFEDVGTVIGYVETATGELDATGIQRTYETARDASRALDDGLQYRLASPTSELVPTAAIGEAGLERAADARLSGEREISELANPAPGEAAAAWQSVESLRLETTNAGGYLGTALDPAAPPRTDSLSELVGGHLEAVASLDAPRPADGHPLPTRLGTVLSTVRSQRSGVLAAADPTEPRNARRLELLFDAIRIRGQLEAYRAAGEVTFPLLDAERGIPGDRLLSRKRAAVDRVGTLAGAAPLQRSLGRLADDMVTYGDRLEADQGSNPVATAHFLYVAAREFVDLSLARGQRLATALDAPHGE
jgi:hypothetical protein